MLRVENIIAAYGKVEAVHGLSFHVNEGEIVTLIGSNGAGKSTTLKSIMRLKPPEAPLLVSGDIFFGGESILSVPSHEVTSKLRMALAPEGRHIFGNLTVMENLTLGAWTRKDDPAVPHDLARIFDLFPRLAERRKQRSDTLSGGEQQMLTVGRALMTGCSLLMLDEPSMGLAPILMYEMFRVLKKLNKEGMTLIIVEQNARLALEVADRGYVLDTGVIVAEGSSSELRDNPDLIRAYLGG